MNQAIRLPKILTLASRHANRLLPAVLLLLPLLVYSSTIFSEFGLRDDYSILREAREEPGKVFHFCTAQARPIYGYLLETSFAQLPGIPGLAWGRMCAALLLGATAMVAALIFMRTLRWPLVLATGTAALLTFLPGAQVIVSWSICWPFALATCTAAVSFACAQNGYSQSHVFRRFSLLAAAVGLLLVSTLIYPSQSLLYLVFVAGLIPLRRDRTFGARSREIMFHALIVGATLAIGFLVVQLFFAFGPFAPSSRIVFENRWLDKLVWVFRHPLRDALGLFTLDDLYGRTRHVQAVSIAATLLILLAGCANEFRRHGWRSGVIWTLSLAGLSVAALCVTLIAAERWAPYRTLYAASGVILVFAVMSVNNLASFLILRPQRWINGLMLTVVVAAGILARHQTWTLFARPQMEELRMVREGALRIDPEQPQDVLILRPSMADLRLPVVFDDEFGSLSTNSDWTPPEMIKQVLRERFSGFTKISGDSRMVVEWWRPAGKRWDVVIDLRHSAYPLVLADARERNSSSYAFFTSYATDWWRGSEK